MSRKHDYIPNLTTKNVLDVGFSEMLAFLKPYVLEVIPEGGHQDAGALREIDRLLGRFANLYSYLIYLYSYVANATNEAKINKDTKLSSQYMRKRDALWEMARSLHYKQNACSRMLTAMLGYEEMDNFERPDIAGREERLAQKTPVTSTKKVTKKGSGWDAIE